MTDENDNDVLAAWARIPHAAPDTALDARVLADFRTHRLRRRLQPAAALAAGLALAFAAWQLAAPVTKPAAPPAAMIRGGMIDRSAATFLMEAPAMDRAHLKRAPTSWD